MSDDEKRPSMTAFDTNDDPDCLLTALVAFLCGFTGCAIVAFVIIWTHW